MGRCCPHRWQPTGPPLAGLQAVKPYYLVPVPTVKPYYLVPVPVYGLLPRVTLTYLLRDFTHYLVL